VGTEQRLRRYASERNDPNSGAESGLSPYLHFGQISAQAAVLRVKASRLAHGGGMDAFVEECVVRRELSDNFCFCKLSVYAIISY
jgi:deoxyribodipyrimidine photo-lyase